MIGMGSWKLIQIRDRISIATITPETLRLQGFFGSLKNFRRAMTVALPPLKNGGTAKIVAIEPTRGYSHTSMKTVFSTMERLRSDHFLIGLGK
jgi:hypothetical protein